MGSGAAVEVEDGIVVVFGEGGWRCLDRVSGVWRRLAVFGGAERSRVCVVKVNG